MRAWNICHLKLSKTLILPSRATSLSQRTRNYGSNIDRQLETDLAVARQWFKTFPQSPLSKEIGDVSYSRSSGPGGQNVNKVNSKAQLRVPLEQLLPLVPSILHEGIRNSKYHAIKSSSLLIQADDSRKQLANRDTCYRKLSEMLIGIYKQTVPGETSQAQKDKVRKLKTVENEHRISRKKLQSNKKAARSKGFGE